MTSKPTILITNDDGITAPGIENLFTALSDFADITIVAPKTNQSCKSLSLTLPSAIKAQKYPWQNCDHAFHVEGTPADCVKFALHYLLDKKPDLICSGINNGHNAGASLLYSGTVAACIQGTIYEIPSIAFSASYSDHSPDFTASRAIIPPIVKHFLSHGIPKGSFINVNTPHQPHAAIKGVRFSTQGKSYWDTTIQKHEDDPHDHFRISDSMNSFQEECHSDIYHIQNGFVTVTPIHVRNLTHHSHFDEHKSIFEKSLGHIYQN